MTTQEDEEEERFISRESFDKLMLTAMRISLVGFGGGLAGISIARSNAQVFRTAAMRSRSSSNNSTTIRGGSVVEDHDLPTAMAFACASFMAVIETVCWLSPGDQLINNYVDEDCRMFHNQILQGEQTKQDVLTVTNLTVGGIVAGSLFKGRNISGLTEMSQRLHKSGQLPKLTVRYGVWSGLLAGGLLGCLAGVLQVSLGRLESYVETTLDEQQQEHTNNISEDDDTIMQEKSSDKSITKEELDKLSSRQLAEKLKKMKEEQDADFDK